MNLPTCHRCPHRQRPCSGACVCLKDGIDITIHAKTGYCPEKRYGDGIKPDGWQEDRIAAFNARPAYPIDGDYEPKKEGGGCGCSAPQAD